MQVHIRVVVVPSANINQKRAKRHAKIVIQANLYPLLTRPRVKIVQRVIIKTIEAKYHVESVASANTKIKLNRLVVGHVWPVNLPILLFKKNVNFAPRDNIKMEIAKQNVNIAKAANFNPILANLHA